MFLDQNEFLAALIAGGTVAHKCLLETDDRCECLPLAPALPIGLRHGVAQRGSSTNSPKAGVPRGSTEPRR